MRLIDADALLIKIDEANYTAIDIKNLIEEAQTVEQDSEPVYQCFYPHDGWSNVSKEMYEDTDYSCDKRILYTSPPKREWRGLSDNEHSRLIWENTKLNQNLKDDLDTFSFVLNATKAIEAKLKEVNGYA